MKVGDKVVCIENNWGPYLVIGEKNPIKGEIYTIREFYTSPVSSKIGVRLMEIINPITPIGIECAFYVKYFRLIEPIGEIIAEYIEQTAFKEYQYQETLKELAK